MLEMKSERSGMEAKETERKEAERKQRLRAYPKVEVIANEGSLIRGYERDFEREVKRFEKNRSSVDHRSQQNRNLKYSLRSLYRFEGSEDSSPHLENCTGRDKTKTANNLFQLVLGDRMFA